MEIIIIGLLAFAGYRFFGHKALAAIEAVRAYLFLDALNKGLSVDTANAIADHVVAEPASDRVKNVKSMAWMEYKMLHGGKELPVIGHAYRQGMRSTMSERYRRKALATQDTLAIEVSYTMKRIQIAAEQQEAINSDGYQAFYRVFSDEVHRLSGEERPNAPAFGNGWEQATLLELYRDGDDPLYLAARFCDEHQRTQETFSTFETYRAAVQEELKRYATDSDLLKQCMLDLRDKPLNDAFGSSMHPRRIAYAYYRSCARRAAMASL